MLPLESQDRLGVIGITGSGKTHYVRANIFRAFQKVVAYDPRGNYLGSETHRVTMGEFAKLVPLLRTLGTYRVCVIPAKTLDEKRRAEEFSDFYKLCDAMLSDTVIIIEETGLWEESKHGQAVINLFATQSRQWDCPLVLVAQRAVQIPPIARSQLSAVVTFRQKHVYDIRALAHYFGDQKAASVARLPRYEHLIWRESDDFL